MARPQTQLSVNDKAAALAALGITSSVPPASHMTAVEHVSEFVGRTGAQLVAAAPAFKDAYRVERARLEAARVERQYAAAQAAGLV